MINPIKVAGPTSLIAALPYLLGFKPNQSLICVLLKQDALSGCIRYELDQPPATLAKYIFSSLRSHQFDALVLVAVIDQIETDFNELLNELRSNQVMLLDFLVTDLYRFRSAMCFDETCCPSIGNELTQEVQDQMAAEMVGMGQLAVNSRADFLTRLAPQGDHEPVQHEIEAITEKPTLEKVWDILTNFHRLGLNPTQIARLAIGLVDPDLRNEVEYQLFDSSNGELTKPDQLRIATENLLNCAVATPTEYAAMPYGMLAFCYWNLGEWILATAAADYALEQDAMNSPARLTKNLLQRNIDPVVARREIFPAVA